MYSASYRNTGLDTLRGAALLGMITYHACWDLVYMFGMDWGWYRSVGAYIWQQSICWTFILLSGYCFHLGQHRLRRGLLAFGGGALVSAVTILLMPGNAVICGVLTLLGSAALLTIPLDQFLQKVPAWVGLVCSFALFLLFRDVSSGFLGFEGIHVAAVPEIFYQNILTAYLGFPPSGFHSTDYFPLLPWLFLFWAGYFLFRIQPPSRSRRGVRLPLITAMGRHSLIIYLVHQPVVYAVLTVLSRLGIL